MATWNVVGRGPIKSYDSIAAAIDAVEKMCAKDLTFEWNPILRNWELRDPARKKYAVMASLQCDEVQCLSALADGLKEARNNTVDGLGNWEAIRSEAHYHRWEAGNVCY